MTSNPKSPSQAGRLPPWLKRRIPPGGQAVQGLLNELHLATVCDGAHCPNRGECYARGTATFLILGKTCTRACRFCAIPNNPPGPPREDEPQAVAEAAARMGLNYAVITSVTRDDLPDGGAGHFARTIRAVRARLPQARVEVLTPDFQGSETSIATVLDARPDVFNHNVETVPRLYPAVRPQADYQQSLRVLEIAKKQATAQGLAMFTKSGLMVGLGESDEEVLQVMRDLRRAECDILTIGQYLAPSNAHFPVARFVEPEQFDAWRDEALKMGFRAAACGPFVRSSYMAEGLFPKA
jgi:lipoic acid synthetase